MDNSLPPLTCLFIMDTYLEVKLLGHEALTWVHTFRGNCMMKAVT